LIVNDAIKEVNDENHIPEPIEPSLADKTQNDVLIFLSKLDQNLVLSENDIKLIVNKYLYNYIKF
jgi:hypothetical protein